ncbi:YwiC-like family protein [uncultured Corynebacterium sp.]|uniref:YwiC-like family protein n=1 Tax=uncultured Corynebacterium sp. TaxID=159447 RepID=UPI0025D692A1|nr:YwiC-like family protein [uncultured Corynebacterium sp.]
MARAVSPWVPNQHGAWAMLLLPIIMGMGLGICTLVNDSSSAGAVIMGVTRSVVLLIAWVVGYFAFFAWGLWVKIPPPRNGRSSERKQKAFVATATYCAITLLAALITVALRPSLLVWAPVFAIVMGVALWEVVRKRPRSLLSGIATVVASVLMVPVADHTIRGSINGIAWWWALMLGIYFTGTIIYVKTMIRERNNSRYLTFSIGYHAAFVLISLVFAVLASCGVVTGFSPYTRLWWTVGTWLLVIAAAISLFRSWAVPRSAHNGGKWTPKRVGKTEQLVTLGVDIALAL